MGYKNLYFRHRPYQKDIWVNKQNKLMLKDMQKVFLSDQTHRYNSITDMYSEISLIFYSLNLYRKYRNKFLI